MAYRITQSTLKNPEEIKQDWVSLEKRSNCSYFQSWGWIHAWMEVVATDLDIIVIKVWYEDLLTGISLFVRKNAVRHHVLISRAIYCNESPFDGRDMVIEYNGFLADKRHHEAVYSKLIHYLLKNYSDADEFFFNGINNEVKSSILDNSHIPNINAKILDESKTWFVALDDIGDDLEGFLQSISKNRRLQIKRSIKTYETNGLIQLEVAQNKEEALRFFSGLKKLHTARWEIKEQGGSFANNLWEQMHWFIIETRYDDGEIQLLRVSNASEAIGYIYSFIWHQRVYVLQTGFKPEKDKRLMPGYVAHAMAINHNKSIGMHYYDLMHGDSLYKRILCNRTQNLYWLVLQRKRLKFEFEDFSKRIKRWIKK